MTTITISPDLEKVVSDVLTERARQNQKWGEQNHDMATWLAILVEEVGELSQAVLHDRFGGKAQETAYIELMHVVAVGVQVMEYLRRTGYPYTSR